MTLQEILLLNSSSQAHKATVNVEAQRAKTAQLLKQNKAAANKILLEALATLSAESPTSIEVKEQIWI